MKILLLAVIIAVAEATVLDEQWQEFKLQYGKSYKSLLEEKMRFAIFQENLHEIEKHNERYLKGEVSYYMGINQFADMTQAEFESTLVLDVPDTQDFELFNGTGIVGDELVNWVTKGLVTEVKNQLHCGSCWAFSSVGAIEAQIKKHGGELISLSAQNLLDCAPNRGCVHGGGGNMKNAFIYVHNHGILKDDEYPAYDAVRHECRKQGGTKVSSYGQVKTYDEDDLLKALTAQGPISAVIDSRRIKHYHGGIFGNEIGCTQKADHAVLIVGAGSEEGKNYWLVKNSWGPTWGEKGYFRITRGENACAISRLGVYPIINDSL